MSKRITLNEDELRALKTCLNTLKADELNTLSWDSILLISKLAIKIEKLLESYK